MPEHRDCYTVSQVVKFAKVEKGLACERELWFAIHHYPQIYTPLIARYILIHDLGVSSFRLEPELIDIHSRKDFVKTYQRRMEELWNSDGILKQDKNRIMADNKGFNVDDFWTQHGIPFVEASAPERWNQIKEIKEEGKLISTFVEHEIPKLLQKNKLYCDRFSRLLCARPDVLRQFENGLLQMIEVRVGVPNIFDELKTSLYGVSVEDEFFEPIEAYISYLPRGPKKQIVFDEYESEASGLIKDLEERNYESLKLQEVIENKKYCENKRQCVYRTACR